MPGRRPSVGLTAPDRAVPHAKLAPIDGVQPRRPQPASLPNPAPTHGLNRARPTRSACQTHHQRPSSAPTNQPHRQTIASPPRPPPTGQEQRSPIQPLRQTPRRRRLLQSRNKPVNLLGLSPPSRGLPSRQHALMLLQPPLPRPRPRMRHSNHIRQSLLRDGRQLLLRRRPGRRGRVRPNRRHDHRRLGVLFVCCRDYRAGDLQRVRCVHRRYGALRSHHEGASRTGPRQDGVSPLTGVHALTSPCRIVDVVGSRVFPKWLHVSEELGNHTSAWRSTVTLSSGYLASRSARMRVLESAFSVPPTP
jgi:hypothetical protein